MTATLNTQTPTPQHVPATLPDGDKLGNDILAAAGTAEVKALLRKTVGGGKSAGKTAPPRVMFEPRAWSISGRVD